jgi:hypothetical protein
LRAAAGVNTVACPHCWRTNFLHSAGQSSRAGSIFGGVPICNGCRRRVDPKEPSLVSCPTCRQLVHEGCWDAGQTQCHGCLREQEEAAERQAEELRRVARRHEERASAFAKLHGWLDWIAVQELMIAFTLVGAFAGTQLVDAVVGWRGYQGVAVPSYLSLVPLVLLPVFYLIAHELGQVMGEWRRKARAAGHGIGTVVLVLWHRLAALHYRLCAMAAGLALATGVVALVPRTSPESPEAAALFLALLVFLLVGFTSLGQIVLGVGFLAAVAAMGYAFDCLGHGRPLEQMLECSQLPFSAQQAVDWGFWATVSLGMALYGSFIAARVMDFCPVCSAYVRRKSPRCPACDLLATAPAVAPPTRGRPARQ